MGFRMIGLVAAALTLSAPALGDSRRTSPAPATKAPAVDADERDRLFELERLIREGGAGADGAFRSAVTLLARAGGPKDHRYVRLLLLRAEGLERDLDLNGAERQLSEALVLSRRLPERPGGSDDSTDVIWGRLIWAQFAAGKVERARANLKDRIAAARAGGAGRRWDLEDALAQKTTFMVLEGRLAEAAEAAAERLTIVGDIKRDDGQLLQPLHALATSLQLTGDYAAALSFAEKAMQISREEIKRPYQTDEAIADWLRSLELYAGALQGTGDSKKAEAMLLEADGQIEAAVQSELGPRYRDHHVQSKDMMAFFYLRNGDYAKMLVYASRRLELFRQYSADGPEAAELVDAHRGLVGIGLCGLGRHEEAQKELAAFDRAAARVGGIERLVASTVFLQERGTCALRAGKLAEALHWSRTGVTSEIALVAGAGPRRRAPVGGLVDREGRLALTLLHASYRRSPMVFGEEEFSAAQMARLTSTDNAVGHAAARAYARVDGKLALVEAFEEADGDLTAMTFQAEAAVGEAAAARERRDRSDEAVRQRRSTGGSGEPTSTERRSIALAEQQERAANARLQGFRAERDRLAQVQQARRAAIETALPHYFGKLQTRPLSLAQLRTGAGLDTKLLRDDEALVVATPGSESMPPGFRNGFVLVVTVDHPPAWAPIGIEPEALAKAIAAFRADLDGPGSTRPIGMAKSATRWGPEGIRRDKSKALYDALFSNPAIARLLAAKRRWTIIPQGSLLSLPFAALVISEPPGGRAGDADPEMLRRTQWLGLGKTLSILPTVSSLLTLRAPRPAAANPTLRFFGIGEPAFTGVGGAAVQGVLSGGQADPSRLLALPRLTTEVSAVAAALRASPSDVLIGANATEGRLRAAAARLSNAAVILFATHGLTARDGPDALREPALALMPPPGRAAPLLPGDDGLLTASEASLLDLNADWVVLSACNTALGDRSGEGLSGLARGFLSAGARGLLVSQWVLRNDVANRLVPDVLLGTTGSDGSRAESLRAAMQKVSDDKSQDESGRSFAHPAAWAVLQYVGADPR